MKNKYTALEKGILERVADLSMNYGPVEISITAETEDGDFCPAFSITKARDGVLRGLMEDDTIASLDLEFGELHILPMPRRLQEAVRPEAPPADDQHPLDRFTEQELLDELRWRATSKR